MEMELTLAQKAKMRRQILLWNKENNNHISSLRRFISIVDSLVLVYFAIDLMISDF